MVGGVWARMGAPVQAEEEEQKWGRSMFRSPPRLID
jgi:hypothetical protein